MSAATLTVRSSSRLKAEDRLTTGRKGERDKEAKEEEEGMKEGKMRGREDKNRKGGREEEKGMKEGKMKGKLEVERRQGEGGK